MDLLTLCGTRNGGREGREGARRDVVEFESEIGEWIFSIKKEER